MKKNERAYIGRIKALPCGNCNSAPPSAAHHIIENGTRVGHYLVIPLCYQCHQGNGGIHGTKQLWLITKNTEKIVLEDTIRRLQND